MMEEWSRGGIRVVNTFLQRSSESDRITRCNKKKAFIDLIFRKNLLDGEEGKEKRKTTPKSVGPERDACRSLSVSREQE